MAELRSFDREKLAVNALALATAVLAFAGVLAMFMTGNDGLSALLKFICVIAFAMLGGCSLMVSMAATACAQILMADNAAKKAAGAAPRFRKTVTLALACAALTASASVLGADLGWKVIRGEFISLPDTSLIDAGGFALAFIKPAMSFVIEAASGVCTQAAAIAAQAERAAERDAETRRLENAAQAARMRAEQASEPKPPAPVPAKANKADKVRSLSATRPRPAIIERAEVSLPVNETELRAAIAKVVDTRSADVVSLETVRAAAEQMLGRRVPRKRIQEHPLRHALFAAAKARENVLDVVVAA